MTTRIVRLYDHGGPGQWIDITGAVSKEEADRVLSENTDGGRKMTRYEDGDYYAIFPAGTQMLFRPETTGE